MRKLALKSCSLWTLYTMCNSIQEKDEVIVNESKTLGSSFTESNRDPFSMEPRYAKFRRIYHF